MYKIISLYNLNLHKCYMLIISQILKEKQKKHFELQKTKIDQIMAQS